MTFPVPCGQNHQHHPLRELQDPPDLQQLGPQLQAGNVQPLQKAYENTVDELTGKQLTFDNVVVCFADIAAYAGDSHDVQSVNYVAGGQAYLFTRGGVQVGRWEKPHPTHPLKLYTETARR